MAWTSPMVVLTPIIGDALYKLDVPSLSKLVRDLEGGKLENICRED